MVRQPSSVSKFRFSEFRDQEVSALWSMRSSASHRPVDEARIAEWRSVIELALPASA